ncbi:NUDIX domain-containing protein [Yinghuangia sp. ASG 101]|uniref:NUDIX hydrolase n=1 Tax=Yinghuangia sp. ASG 101 TaxID=2896848 RepID=UPI001E3FA5C2|nr:NUDIX domain-containing protein [Yinghuangia sp. ASG 101]UGQ13322.1 NUDIX domain-containing protein [Yinghuangia sp. ASG 101]
MNAASSADGRFLTAVDVHVLLIDGGRVLMLRRGPGSAYAPGLWTLPSGHLEAGEDVVAAAIRETREETGIALTPELLRCELVMQHQGPRTEARARTGWFFRALGWPVRPRPHNAEPHKHDGLMWADLDDLDAVPDGVVGYVRAALDAIAAGVPYALHFQPTGSPVAHVPGAGSALRALPSADHHNVPLRGRFGVREWTRAGLPWTWVADAEVPDGLTVRQSWGWLFAPDGRVLVLAGANGVLNLPGGTVEPEDRDPLATLAREAHEEAGAVLGKTAPVGYLHDHEGLLYDGAETARLRTAAVLASLHPAAVDPATGFTWRRLLMSPRMAANLMGGGPESLAEALAAQRVAHEHLGIPPHDGRTVDEAPEAGVVFA